MTERQEKSDQATTVDSGSEDIFKEWKQGSSGVKRGDTAFSKSASLLKKFEVDDEVFVRDGNNQTK